jgi:putative peptidoglycan lipid II flippase
VGSTRTARTELSFHEMRSARSAPRGLEVNRSILRAAAALMLAGICVKIIAAFKEVAVASVYGRSDAMDAFLAAMLLPALLVNLISESMNQALVPSLIQVREREGRNAAQQLVSSSMLCMCLLLVAISAVAGVAAPEIFSVIASNFSPEKRALAIHVFYGLLPIVLLTGIATTCTAVLNSLDQFALPALAPMMISIATILSALLLAGDFGIWALVFATVAGSMAQAVFVAALMHSRGCRFQLRWYGRTVAAREVAGQYWPILLSGVVASGGLVVDQSMAAMLPAGSVSALAYANRFVSVAMTLLAGAISTAVLPTFSRMVARQDWAACRMAIRTWVGWSAMVSIPLTGMLIAGARTLIRAALQHGAFGPRDTAVVWPVLTMYALQIPFFVCSRVFYRFLLAKKRSDLILSCGILNLVLDIGLNLVLMRWLGIAGIALATSLWSASTFFFLGYFAWKLLPVSEHKDVLIA